MESSPTDGAQILTPLIGRSLKSLPSNQTTGGNIEILRHWNLCQNTFGKNGVACISNSFNDSKSGYPKRSLLVGDIVLRKDPELFLKSCPLAIVEQVHPGADGLVRVATVRKIKGTYKRAVTANVPLVTCRITEDVQDYCPSPLFAWSSTFKCYYKTTSVKYIFIMCNTILAAVHSSSWFCFDYYQSPGQTDASASQGTRVSDDNMSANSIHIHLHMTDHAPMKLEKY